MEFNPQWQCKRARSSRRTQPRNVERVGGEDMNRGRQSLQSADHILSLSIVVTDCPLFSYRTRRELVVLDYSSPNIGKEMHVGHLRTTIVGCGMEFSAALPLHTCVRRARRGFFFRPDLPTAGPACPIFWHFVATRCAASTILVTGV